MKLFRNEDQRVHWQDDNEAESCTCCGRDFSAFFRRHHCRLCGAVVCGKCSSDRCSLTQVSLPLARVPGVGWRAPQPYNEQPKRVCSVCKQVASFQKTGEALRPVIEKESRVRAAVLDTEWEVRRWLLHRLAAGAPGDGAGVRAAVIADLLRAKQRAVASVLRAWAVLTPHPTAIVHAAMDYVGRLVAVREVKTCGHRRRALLGACLSIAAKLHSEGCYPDCLPALDGHAGEATSCAALHARCAGVSVADLNAAEVFVLRALDWNLLRTTAPWRRLCELREANAATVLQRAWRGDSGSADSGSADSGSAGSPRIVVGKWLPQSPYHDFCIARRGLCSMADLVETPTGKMDRARSRESLYCMTPEILSP